MVFETLFAVAAAVCVVRLCAFARLTARDGNAAGVAALVGMCAVLAALTVIGFW